jgi:hypothetical protein
VAVESDAGEGTEVIAVECETLLDDSNGLSGALDSTGVVEGAGEGYMGLYRGP